MNKAYIAFGANQGDPKREIKLAVADLEACAAARVLRISSFYKTSPVDSSGPDYVNAVALIETELEPLDLLHAMQEIENTHGRKRTAGVRNEPRTMDLDVLTFNDEQINEPELVVPHPRMTERLFVMVPLSEVDPEWTSPDGRGIFDVIETIKREHPDQQIEKEERIMQLP